MRRSTATIYSLPRRALTEAFGTAVLCLVGPGSVVASQVMLGGQVNLLAVAFAFGFTVATLVYSIGKVSGCHINPAVTFALAATGRFPWRDAPSYWAAQLVGGTVGALGVWAAYGPYAISLGMGQTHILAAASIADLSRAALAEGIGTGLLVLAILGITDRRSPQQLAGLVIGASLTSIILVFGPADGASLNPARALGPELVSALGGGPTYWAQLVPVYVIPGLVGAALFAYLYDYIADPRRDEMPIQEAVSHQEPEV